MQILFLFFAILIELAANNWLKKCVLVTKKFTAVVALLEITIKMYSTSVHAAAEEFKKQLKKIPKNKPTNNQWRPTPSSSNNSEKYS